MLKGGRDLGVLLSSKGKGIRRRPPHLLQVDVLVPVAHPDSRAVQVLRHHSGSPRADLPWMLPVSVPVAMTT